MNNRVDIIVLGESSRPDIPLRLNLPKNIEIKVHAVLNDMTIEEIEKLKWNHKDNTQPIYANYKKQTFILDKEKLLPLLQKSINELEEKSSLIMVYSIESFKELTSISAYLLQLDRIMLNMSDNISLRKKEELTFGIFTPEEDKFPSIKKKWANKGKVYCTKLKPGSSEKEIYRSCEKLKEEVLNPDYIIFDCIGYDSKELKLVSRRFDTFIISPIFCLKNNIKLFFAEGKG